MNNFTIFFTKFLQNILQNAPNCIKNSQRNMPPNPHSKCVGLPLAAWREAPCKYLHFSKNMLTPPPLK